MPRQRRVVIPDCPHHITQRGNNRRTVFFTDSDRAVFLTLLKEYTSQYAVKVLGYCLMSNHVHVIATPTTPTGLAKAFGRTYNDYSRMQNIRRRECGYMWQSRYYSCPIESRYLWAVLSYVERNPVRAGMVSASEEWYWSSAQCHLASPASGTWLSLADWSQHWTADSWRTALMHGMDEANLRARLAEATATGRPLGEAEFVEACEEQSGLILRRRKPGPKPKQQDKKALSVGASAISGQIPESW